jgi:hypothetical protein
MKFKDYCHFRGLHILMRGFVPWSRGKKKKKKKAKVLPLLTSIEKRLR